MNLNKFNSPYKSLNLKKDIQDLNTSLKKNQDNKNSKTPPLNPNLNKNLKTSYKINKNFTNSKIIKDAIIKGNLSHNKPKNSYLLEKINVNAKDLSVNINSKTKETLNNLKNEFIPKIHIVSQKIDRNKFLFSERLYPYHKLSKLETQKENSFELAHVATLRSNPLGISGEFDNEEYKSNIDAIFFDDEEIKNLYGNKPEFLKYYRGLKIPKKEQFPFKPTISKNSLSLVKNYEEKELKKSNSVSLLINQIKSDSLNGTTFKNSNEKEFYKSNGIKNFYGRNLLENFNLIYEQENFRKNKNYYLIHDKNRDIFNSAGKKICEKSIKISNKIYEKGINMLKKKERLIEEKNKGELQELKSLTFMPHINKEIKINSCNNLKINRFNSEMSKTYNNNFMKQNIKNNINSNKSHSPNFNKSYYNSSIKYNLNSSNDHSTNISNNLIINKTYNQSFNISNYSLNHLEKNDKSNLKSEHENNKSSTTFYERSSKWRDNKEKKKNKMREIINNQEKKKYSFSPIILTNNENYLDDKFIKLETKHIQSYLTRRKNSIDKENKKKNYEDKIFGKNFTNFKSKITRPKEFIFKQSISRKDKNKGKILHRAESVGDYRKEFSTTTFFNESILEYNQNNVYNNEDDKFFSNKFNEKNKYNKIIENNRRLINENLNKNKTYYKMTNNNMRINFNVNIMMK